MYRKIFITSIILLLILFLPTVGGCANTGLTAEPSSAAAQVTTETPVPEAVSSPAPVPTSIAQPALPSIADVVAKVKPSVVAINVEVTARDIFNRPATEKGAGSGWIISEDGYIVTNNHVVEGADSVMVTLADGTSYNAEDIKTDPLTDLAVVKIDAHNLPAAGIGQANDLQVGYWVVALGNPLDQGISATTGIVSALDASVPASPGQTLHGLIQTDAAINPGNSGGPLVNMAGEVIGINSIKVAQVGVEGMGYAISIDTARPIIDQLIETGYIVRPWLGVGIYEVDEYVAGLYNLSADKGLLITEVVADSPADEAGLEMGDVITKIDDREMAVIDDLVTLIDGDEVGQTITITFLRGETEMTVSAVLAQSPLPQF